MKLISVEEAKKIVSGSEERKNDLIGLMNNGIKDQAQQGLRWAHLPNGITTEEAEWLKDELIINGFTVGDKSPAVKW